MLGIPTVTDRLIQQAIAQKLIVMYDGNFSDSSFGFRPQRSAHQAVERALYDLNNGSNKVVELDLEKFFDQMCIRDRRCTVPFTLTFVCNQGTRKRHST